MDNNLNIRNDNSNLRIDSINEILTVIPHWIIRVGNYCIFAIFLITVILAWQFKYEKIDDYPATIAYDHPIEQIFSPINGKIISIFKKNNSNVKTNQPILVVSENNNYHALDTIRSKGNGKLILLEEIIENKIILKHELIGVIQSELSSNSIRISIELEPISAEEMFINQPVIFTYLDQDDDNNYSAQVIKISKHKNQKGMIIVDVVINDNRFYSELEKNIVPSTQINGMIRVKSKKKSLIDRFVQID